MLMTSEVDILQQLILPNYQVVIKLGANKDVRFGHVTLKVFF